MKDEEEIDRFDLRSSDITEDKQAELLRMFPEIRTEGGKIDFERLKIVLGESLKIDGQQRRSLADVSFAVIECVSF